MTKEALKESALALAAWATGIPIQFRSNDGIHWLNFTDRYTNPEKVLGAGRELRITPSPKKRLVTMKELPFPCALCWPGKECVHTVTIFNWNNDSLYVCGTARSIQDLADRGVKYSSDGKTWKSFMIEDV